MTGVRRKHHDLVAWQVSVELVKSLYELTETFPTRETYGLTTQIRRAAVSVPSNIAEGQGRKSTPAYTNHLSIAFGSLMELKTQIQIALSWLRCRR